MTTFRLIAPQWLMDTEPNTRKVLEGQFSQAQLDERNAQGYNIYYLPNHPSVPVNGTVDGSHIDKFNYVFVDYDLKDGTYESKEAFIEVLGSVPTPSRIVDSGGGIHAYWRVSDLDALSYLRLCRRLIRKLRTDVAVGQIFQLMRYPGSVNTKLQDNPRLCEVIYESESVYTCEELDSALPPITVDDEKHVQQHYDKTYKIDRNDVQISDVMPDKFGRLLLESSEANRLWTDASSDRSAADYRLGHIMFAKGFSRDEAATVLANSAKALNRAPVHRLAYATNIVDKIWVAELEPEKAKKLSFSVADLLATGDAESLKGTRFPCYKYFDGSDHGFRLGQVIGLVAGVGVGKTAISLNLFKGFVEQNPAYIHMFVSLEQPGREIAARWAKMCGTNTQLHSKVHVLSNYNDDGTYRNLSLTDIQNYILEFQKETGLKIGCVTVDHIGVLRQEKMKGEYQGLSAVCAQLKSFAIATNTLLVMQSQTNRDKAGIGDLELFKDAAYGTQSFESYLDYLMVCWQPLKRCYDNPQCPRVTAYKFAKVRFKSKKDVLIEDQCYRLLFDQDTETLRTMTQDEETAFDFFAKSALNIRKKDRKTDLVAYTSVRWSDKNETSLKVANSQTDSDRQPRGRSDLN